jgi:hypothetical protein
VNAEIAALGGLNALSLVVMCGEPSTAQALLDAGADPNLPSLRSKTPFELARKLNRTEMIEVLEPRTTVRQTTGLLSCSYFFFSPFYKLCLFSSSFVFIADVWINFEQFKHVIFDIIVAEGQRHDVVLTLTFALVIYSGIN